LAGAEERSGQRGEAIEGRLILFDVDGTLVDSPGLIVDAIRQAFVDCGLDAPSEEDARGVIGLSLAAAMAQLCPDPAQWGRLADAYRRAWRAREDAVRLVSGMDELIRWLRAQGAYLGIATGKSRRGLQRMLRLLGLEDCFDVVRTADDCPSKPHPAMVQECAEELGLSPQQAVVVGDAIVDVQMARAAGAQAIGVAWGCASEEGLLAAGAMRVVREPEELRPALLGWAQAASRLAAA